MKTSKTNHLAPQNKNLTSNSVIHGFSNPQNFTKSKTQKVTPNTVRSPPSGPAAGSGIHKLNVDYAKNQLNQEGIKQKNLENMGGLSRSSTGSNQAQMKKDFVSMEQALGFLNFINKNQNDAFRMPVIPLQEIQAHSQNVSRQTSQLKAKEMQKKLTSQTPPLSVMDGQQAGQKQEQFQEDISDQMSLNENKKKLNKNRAIKRIIETAYQLLQKNYHFTSVQNQLSQEQRSTSTQFNIYLKQYNRIIQQINSKEYEEIETSNLLYDRNEQELQEVFQYTVMDDFREKLSAFFTKERLGKDNVDLMIKAFRDALVSLKLNQLKVEYFDSQQPPKIIKMSQIQNVQYYTHPYIFIALTINKDKTKSKEQLYLKFSSEQNQDKWDRALYCCFMSRKMVKKQKLFEIQFPVEDVMKKQKAQFKKQDQNYQMNDQFKVIDKVFRERQGGRSPTTNSITHTLDNNEPESNILSDRPDYMNLAKNRTQDKIPMDDDVRRVNTVMTGNKNQTSPFRNIQMKTTLKNPQNKRDPTDTSSPGFENGMTPGKQQSVFVNDHHQEDSNLSKKSTFNVNNNTGGNANNEMHPRSNTLPQNPEDKPNPTTNPSNPFMKLLRIAQEEPQKKYPEQKPSILNPQQQVLEPNQQALRKEQERRLQEKLFKLKKIREIEKNNVRGVICQKEKFFMNKEKIVFFFDESLLNSSRKLATNEKAEMTHLQSLKTLTSQQIQATKFLEYWDYDYKKDQKEERKLIPVLGIVNYKIIPSTLGQTTTSLVLTYSLENKGDNKELRLIFANPISSGFTSGVSFGTSLNKAQEVFEWIRLVKSL